MLRHKNFKTVNRYPVTLPAYRIDPEYNTFTVKEPVLKTHTVSPTKHTPDPKNSENKEEDDKRTHTPRVERDVRQLRVVGLRDPWDLLSRYTMHVSRPTGYDKGRKEGRRHLSPLNP